MSADARHSHHHHDQPVPRAALIAAGALVAFALVTAAAGRLGDIGTTRLAGADTVESRHLRFDDRDDGAVVVTDAASDRTVAVLEPGTNGFVRGTLRGLARERRMHAIGSEPPFVLTRLADGRLSLDDPETGRSIPLEAFGPTNAAAFARLLTEGRTP